MIQPEDQHYDLREIYARESALRRYIRLTVGEGAGLWSLAWHELVLGFCHWVPGLPGFGLRCALYPLLFPGIDRRAFIGHHVGLRCPRQVQLGPGVIVDDYVQLVATTRSARGIRLGPGSFVRSFACLNAGPPEGFIEIGRNSGIGQGSVLYGNGGLTIGDDVMIAGQCFIVASSHALDDAARPISQQGFLARGIVIEDGVWIGAGAKVLDGVRIGKGAVVAANAVVNRDVNAHDVVGGIPARVLRSRYA